MHTPNKKCIDKVAFLRKIKKYAALYNVFVKQLNSIAIILEHIGRLARMSVLDTEVDGSNPGSSTLFP